MVCASENGKTVVSITDAGNECSHKHQKKDCCLPAAKQQEAQPETSSCCDYSYHFQKVDDETLVQQQLSSVGHVLPVMWLNTLVAEITGLFEVKVPPADIPPFLLSLRKQSFQSFTGVFTI